MEEEEEDIHGDCYVLQTMFLHSFPHALRFPTHLLLHETSTTLCFETPYMNAYLKIVKPYWSL